MQDHKYFVDMSDLDSELGKCFFCRIELIEDKRQRNADAAYTEEHVIPNKILRKFSWNQTEKHKPIKGIFENGSFSEGGDAYSAYKLPCCRVCNTKRLNKGFESITAELLNAKAKHVKDFDIRSVDRYEVYAWMAFLFYKFYYMEKMREHKKGFSDSISVKWMREIYLLLLGQCNLVNLRLSMNFPGSILFFRCKTAEDMKLNFDFLDRKEQGIFAIRLGEIGIIASLYDHGYLENEFVESPAIFKIRNKSLNPLQFRSVVAFAEYSLKRLSRMPPYSIQKLKDAIDISCYPYHFVRQSPPSEEMRRAILANHLHDPAGTFEFLFDSKGKFLDLDFMNGIGNIKTNTITD